MKQFLALLIALVTVFSLTACNQVNENPDGTNGDAVQTGPDSGSQETESKPLTKTVYYWSQKKVTHGVTIDTYSREYDEKGNLLKEEYHNQNHSSAYSYTYTYDEKGNCLSETYENKNGEAWSITYTYDENGNKATETVTDANGSETTEFYYDEKGLLVKKVQLHSMDTQIVTEYTYSRKGFLLKEEVYKVLSQISEKISSKEYTYNIHGKVETCLEYEGDKLLSRNRYLYDDKGRLTAQIDGLDDEQGKGMTYTYNRFGKILTESTGSFLGDQMQSISYYDELDYNERGLISLRVRFDANGNVITDYDYDYDANWNLKRETACNYGDSKVSVTEYTYIGIEFPIE